MTFSADTHEILIDDMLKKISPLARLSVRARQTRIPRIWDFGQFWPKCASVFVRGNLFLSGEICSCEGKY